MKSLKKLFTVMLLIFGLLLLVGCGEDDNKTYKVLLPSGTPLMAVGGLLDDAEFDFKVVNGQDPLISGFTSAEYDMIIAPINLGTKFYIAGNSNYQFKAIITTNNTYIISKGEISSLNDLQGKKITAFGASAAPGLALKGALDIKGIDATVNYQNSAADVMMLYSSNTDDSDFYLSAEPNITKIEDKTGKPINKISLQEQIKDELPVLIQACLFVNPNSNVSNKVINKIKENIENMNKNPENYAKQVLNKNDFFNGLGESVIAKAIPNCNIDFIEAKDNKDVITKYYDFLNKYQNAVLGGKTPSEEFYI